MNFMIIRRFLMYFADFRANFCVFLTIILFYWLKNHFYMSNIMITIGYNFMGKNHFLLRNTTKKMAKIGTIFLKFLKFFVFFCF